MEVIIPCCAGLDVHKRTIVACVRRLGPDGQINQEVRSFGTLTADLLSLADWLVASGVTQVAMESTGVDWKPVSNLLETRFTLLVVNAQHIKQVPGRKTDVKDCQGIAQLLQHGLWRSSFVPPQLIRQLRDLTRQRTQLIRQRATMANRLQKVLEDANIKLASVATDILDVSGRAMIGALIAGEQDPMRLAGLARRGGVRRPRWGWIGANVGIALSDGGVGLEHGLQTSFGRVEAVILDFYHATEYRAALGRALHPSDEVARQAWRGTWCHRLQHHGGVVVLEDLGALEVRGRVPREALAEVVRYSPTRSTAGTIRAPQPRAGPSVPGRWNRPARRRSASASKEPERAGASKAPLR